MRTIAPINSGFLLSSALLILCLACTHANGEVNSKELLDDVGFDLDVESTSAIATQTTHGDCTDTYGGQGWKRKTCQAQADAGACLKYMLRRPDRDWCRSTCGLCGQTCDCGTRTAKGGDCTCASGGTPPSTPSTPSASPPASAGGQQADEQAYGCFFCGKPCPNDCWNAMKSRVDEVVKNGGHIYNLYGFPGTISKCTAANNAISGGRGNPRQVYYAALVKMGTRYYQDRKKNVDWSPAGGWLQYGVNQDEYCNTWKCGPDDYAKYGRSSALGCKNTCSSFDHPDTCKHAAPKCKWVPWNGWGSCKDVDQAELLQTTDNQTETGLTNVQQSTLDRILDD